jgi:hypothetical protein
MSFLFQRGSERSCKAASGVPQHFGKGRPRLSCVSLPRVQVLSEGAQATVSESLSEGFPGAAPCLRIASVFCLFFLSLFLFFSSF